VVGYSQLGVVQFQHADKEPWHADLLGRWFSLLRRWYQLQQIDSAVTLADQLPVQAIQADLPEAPGPAHQAAELEIQIQTVKSQQRRSIGFSDRKPAGLGAEHIGINADFLDLHRAVQQIAHNGHQLTLGDPGGKKKAAKSVEKNGNHQPEALFARVQPVTGFTRQT